MIIATTGKTAAGEYAPIVFRGDYEKIIPAAASVGYKAIELHIHDSAQLDRGALKSLLQANSMILTSVGTGSAYGEDRLFLSSEDAGVREKAIQRIRDHIVTAADYGAVVIIGLIKGLIRDSASREVCLTNLRQSMRTLLTDAENHQVRLVFEVINRYESDFFNTIRETLDFVEEFNTPLLQLHIDTYHMNIEEPNMVESIRAAKGRIGHVHIADSDRWYAGHGHYDFRETVEALREIGYDGALAVESYYFPDPETSAKESLATLKSCMETPSL